MRDSDRSAITNLLLDWRRGDPQAMDRLLPLVYPNLRHIARQLFANESVPHTLQPTALLHEAYLRLLDAGVDWKDRVHFYAIVAREMRRVLVDHARRKAAARHGGGLERTPLTDGAEPSAAAPLSLVEVDEALERLHAEDERIARCVELHYFGAMGWDEIAEVLGTSRSTVARDLRFGKAWLLRAISGEAPNK